MPRKSAGRRGAGAVTCYPPVPVRGVVVERQAQPHDGPSGRPRTRTKERTATIDSTRTQTDVLGGLSGVIATDLTSYQPQPIAELATRAGLYPLGA